MLLDDGCVYLLDRHLDRLEASAGHFRYPFDRAGTRASVEALAAARPRGRFRIRLLLSAGGRCTPGVTALGPPVREYRAKLSSRPVDAGDPMLSHKTTHRPLYVSERNAALAAGYDEVLFMNSRGELTEGSVSNVFVERGGRMLTPPVRCGLLPGTFRGELLDAGRCGEAVLTAVDLSAADHVFVGNSVRGLVPVRVEK
jgi:para-aminobenzoate synthetase/4-amino-4-deoxychorismate lyase